MLPGPRQPPRFAFSTSELRQGGREREVPEPDIEAPLDCLLAVKAKFFTLDGEHGVINELACRVREKEHVGDLRELVRFLIEEVVSETAGAEPPNTVQELRPIT